VNELLQNDLTNSYSKLNELIETRKKLKEWHASHYVNRIDQFLQKPLLQRYELILKKYRSINNSEEIWKTLVKLNTDNNLLDIIDIFKRNVTIFNL
jgi:hypothetical protein